MKYCRQCGKELLDEAVVCPKCGCSTGYKVAVSDDIDTTPRFCEGEVTMVHCVHCGAEVKDTANVCPECGCLAQVATVQGVSDKGVSAWAVILSLLVPIAGLIYAVMDWSDNPRSAKSCLVAALIGAFFAYVLYINMVMP